MSSFSLMMRNVNLSYQLIACFFIYLPIFVFTLLIKLTLLLQNKLFGFLIIQWNPAITKCHGTEKSVRYSGVFVIAKTPL